MGDCWRSERWLRVDSALEVLQPGGRGQAGSSALTCYTPKSKRPEGVCSGRWAGEVVNPLLWLLHAAAVRIPLAVLLSGWLRYHHYFSARHSLLALLRPRQIDLTRGAPLHKLATTSSPTLFDVLPIHSSSAYSRGQKPPKCP